MTQTLDANEGLARIDRPHVTPATTATATTASKFGTFAITFGIAFAILYTTFERLNWPLFTYHPAVGKLDFWMQPARSGEGPPMYWYGWVVLSATAACVLGWIATMISGRRLQRVTVFCCVLAVLWWTVFAIAVLWDERTSYDTELMKSYIWMSAIPALLGAAASSYFVPIQWAQRTWTAWLLIMPIGGLVILGYSLKQYFLR